MTALWVFKKRLAAILAAYSAFSDLRLNLQSGCSDYKAGFAVGSFRDTSSTPYLNGAQTSVWAPTRGDPKPEQHFSCAAVASDMKLS